MKIIHLNFSDISGGAARAAYRIHKSLLEAGIDSRMWVNRAISGDWTVEGPKTRVGKALVALGPHILGPLVKTLRTGNPIIHSPALLPSHWVKRINSSDADIVHLHWVQSEMLSIADIARIKKPVVWTLHDMWAFCGAEHLAWDERWRDGYRRDNRPAHESGFDLNRWAWQRKRKYWRKPIEIVAPSRWLASCVRESMLMGGWPVSVVANPIDTDRWTPLERLLARDLLGLPKRVPLLLFGSYGANHALHKGFDLLLGALENLREDSRVHGMELVIFGQSEPEAPPSFGFPVHYIGHLYDDLSLRVLLSAADAMVIPSRQDNLPNTGIEAHACATPVIAFRTGGLPDIISHRRTGYLAKPFDIEDLADGIAWVVARRETGRLGLLARERAEALFASRVVAEKYRAIYQKCQNPGAA